MRKRSTGSLNTVNDPIEANSRIKNVACLINAPPYAFKCEVRHPSLANKRPYESYSKMLGISRKEQSHSIRSVSCLIDKTVCALHLVQRQVQRNDFNNES